MKDAWRIVRHGRVDSTSERALAALAAGEARHGDVHVARAQSAGRGRRGARWESAEGEGLFASYVLLPAPPGPPAPLATMSAGLAVLDAVRALGLSRARLDWPNDLVVGDAKLAGVLVETRGLDPQRPHLVVGIGLNVRQASFSAELERERSVTSLLREGVEVELDTALLRLTDALRERWRVAVEDPDSVPPRYVEEAGLTRGPVRVEHAGGELLGRIRALDLRLGLQLETGAGERHVLPLEHVRAVAPESAS